MYVKRCAAAEAPEICVISIAETEVVSERTYLHMISLRKRKRRHQQRRKDYQPNAFHLA
jgi:hypothetical protein